jgi:hypothetical protein
MKPEDRNVASVELLDVRIGVLGVVIRDDQHGGRHRSGLEISDKLLRAGAGGCRSLAVNPPGLHPTVECLNTPQRTEIRR